MRMPPDTRRRWLLGALFALVALALSGAVAFRAAVSLLKGRVAQALGPTSQLADPRVGWSGKHLQAHGTLTFIGLQLDPGGGVLNTLMGISRSAVLASLEEKGGKLSADFTLEGDIASPDFTLNEALSTRLAYSLAETLGFSLGGLVEGAGRLGQKGGQAAGDAAKGVGGAIRDLLKGDSKK